MPARAANHLGLFLFAGFGCGGLLVLTFVLAATSIALSLGPRAGELGLLFGCLPSGPRL